jgi:hypothetical protein
LADPKTALHWPIKDDKNITEFAISFAFAALRTGTLRAELTRSGMSSRILFFFPFRIYDPGLSGSKKRGKKI